MRPMKQFSLVLLALGLFTGCESDSVDNNNTGEATIPASVTFKTQLTLPRAANPSEFMLEQAKILVDKMEFENDIEDDGMAEDSLEFETEPFVVELNSGASTTIANTLPIGGEFDEIEVDIEPMDENSTPLDEIFVDGENRYSIVAQGTYNGADFLFRSDMEIELEMDLNPSLIVEAGVPVNVDIVVDLSQWFLDSNGNPMDPNLPENQDLIENNIKNSFQAAEDDDNDDNDNDNDGD